MDYLFGSMLQITVILDGSQFSSQQNSRNRSIMVQVMHYDKLKVNNSHTMISNNANSNINFTQNIIQRQTPKPCQFCDRKYTKEVRTKIEK